MPQAALNERDRKFYFLSRSRKGVQYAWIVFFLTLLGTLLWGSFVIIRWMKDTCYQSRLNLVVTGKHDYTTYENIQQAIQELGDLGTFMTQDVDIIQQQILRFPWIKRVDVRKQWPDKLKIHLVEYIPIAFWNDFRKIDVDGGAFSEPEEWIDKKNFPMLYGPEGSEKEVLDGYRTMSTMLAVSKYTLKIVVMSARHAWQLILDNDARLELGRDDRTSRLQRFIDLYPVLQQQGQDEGKRISYIDLRYESGASIIWFPLLIDSRVIKTQHKSNQQQN